MAKANTAMQSTAVSAYLASFPKPVHAALEKLRQQIRKLAPEAQEQFSYRIVCFKHHGVLVGLGATENHCSFYACHATILKSYKEELKNFKHSGGTIHFSPEKPIPATLLKQIVQQRLAQNEDLNAKKERKKSR